LEGTLKAVESFARTRSRATRQDEPRTPVKPSKEGPVKMTKRVPVAEAGARKRTMPLGTSSPKKGALGESRDLEPRMTGLASTSSNLPVRPNLSVAVEIIVRR
jgi:hypothetical protein